MTEPRFRSDMGVTYIDGYGTDASFYRAAKVSTATADPESELPASVRGLLGYLIRNRHACYSADTEVLTGRGWVTWPDVKDDDTFLSRDLNTGTVELQVASRVVRDSFDGELVSVQGVQVDLLVTDNHNMVAQRRIHRGYTDDLLVPAAQFFDRAHKLVTEGGYQLGSLHAPEDAWLVGFIAADAHVGPTDVSFHITKKRKIDELKRRAGDRCSARAGDTYGLIKLSDRLREWARQTYTVDRQRTLPAELIRNGDVETLRALLDGYLFGDGHVRPNGSVDLGSISTPLVDALQSVAARCGEVIRIQKARTPGRGGYPNGRPYIAANLSTGRTHRPRVGHTLEDRARQVRRVHYKGTVYCATVPSGTLYVRRNGKPAWSGNSPFEHGGLTFLVEVPIFVSRELVRHRTLSFNETSGRYRKLEGTFYKPIPRQRPMVQEGSAAHYTLSYAAHDQQVAMAWDMERMATGCWHRYEDLLADGAANEVARMVLPVSTYTQLYVSGNPRSWLNFLSLRSAPDALHEIRELAEKIEKVYARRYPVTHELWNENGRGQL